MDFYCNLCRSSHGLGPALGRINRSIAEVSLRPIRVCDSYCTCSSCRLTAPRQLASDPCSSTPRTGPCDGNGRISSGTPSEAANRCSFGLGEIHCAAKCPESRSHVGCTR